MQGERPVNTSDSFSTVSLDSAVLLKEHFAQATSLACSGNYQQALILFQELLATCPNEYTLQNNCAWLLEKLGRYTEAEAAYRLLFEAMPDYASGALGYARMLEQDKQYFAAVSSLRRSIAVAPDNPKLLSGLGNALIMSGDAEAALLWYGLSIELDQHDRTAVSNFLYTLLMVFMLTPQVVARELDMCAATPELAVRISKTAKQLRTIDGKFVSGMHRQFGTPHMIEALSLPYPDHSRRERIRVGYISADLYAHPVGYFLEGVLLSHDRKRFEVVVFSPYAERDGLTAALKKTTEHWIVLQNDDRLEALRQIRAYDLDIAVDMAGHTGGNCLDLFAQRLAPLQITWGGYPGTTGLATMDYILADQVALPPEDVPYYTEHPLYMPHGYVSFIPPRDAPLPGILPALATGCITFGSFNTVQKLNSSTLALWGAVLRTLPGSRLFLKSKGFDDPMVCNTFLEKLAAEGVSPMRITMEGYAPRRDLLTAYQQIDIALDPVPYQGGVTVLEALWMGVPTLVLRGNRPPFVRHAESHLTQVGLTDWIAATEEGYVAKAVSWSRNLPALSALRSGLRQQMAASPICDTVGFTRDLEAVIEQAYHGMVSFSERQKNHPDS